MSVDRLRLTIRRCTAAVLVVLGAIAVEVASLEYPDGGHAVGSVAIVAGSSYLLGSAFVGLVARSGPDASADGESADGDAPGTDSVDPSTGESGDGNVDSVGHGDDASAR